MRKILILFAFLLMVNPLLAAGEFKSKFDPVREKRYSDFARISFIVNTLKNSKSVGENIYEFYPAAFISLDKFIKENPGSYFLLDTKILFAELYTGGPIFYVEDALISQKISEEVRQFYRICKNNAVSHILDITNDKTSSRNYFDIDKGESTVEPIMAIALYNLAIMTDDAEYVERLKKEYPGSSRIEKAEEVIPRFGARRIKNDK